jgi:predicted metal-dependent hydrolase
MDSTAKISYKINYSRRHTISIVVSPANGVIVKAPYHVPVKTIEKFVNEKSDWINKTIGKFSSLIRVDKKDGYVDGDQILLFGKNHKLVLTEGNNYSVNLGQDETIMITYHHDKNPLLIKSLLEDWFKYIARQKLGISFREMLIRYSRQGFSPSGFTVRKMKTRWGTCSSKGKIALSYDLVRLDKIFSEYVIVHELCHLQHHNHGQGFYRLLSELYPEWKQVRDGLKRYIR